MLRPIEWTDLEWVRKERNRPECRQWFRQNHLLTEIEQKKWFETTDMMSYTIIENMEMVGVTSLSHIDYTARKAEFSIMIIPEERGKGYSKEALWELLKIAFEDLNMEQVYSDVFEGNSVLEIYLKWGFKEYGILPRWYFKNGKYIDSTIISITKEDYVNSLK